MSRVDIAKLKQDIRPRAVIDLRTPREPIKQREISFLGEMGRLHAVGPVHRENPGPLDEEPAAPPEVKELPDVHWEASAESMARFLALLRREYGSAAGYLEAHGADDSLPRRLEEALLV